jgi:hypothetical protein
VATGCSSAIGSSAAERSDTDPSGPSLGEGVSGAASAGGSSLDGSSLDGAPIERPSSCASISRRFSSSLLMSIRQPVSLAASRTFCPFLPMASDNCLSSTMTSITFSRSSVMDTRCTFAGLRALVTKLTVSSENSTMSIFSPRNSRMIACTRVPFMPTQAPTGSTSRSRE